MTNDRDFYQSCSEAALILLARDGDKTAFEHLVLKRQSSVRQLMRRFCGDPSLGDDLAQLTFIKVYQSLPSLQSPGAFGGWLKRIAVSIWLQHLRKNDALRDAELIDSVTATSTTPGLERDLEAALSILPSAVRTCVVLAYQEGYTHPEVADVTGLSLGTVKSHIKRGAQKMQQFLNAYADEDRAGV